MSMLSAQPAADTLPVAAPPTATTVSPSGGHAAARHEVRAAAMAALAEVAQPLAMESVAAYCRHRHAGAWENWRASRPGASVSSLVWRALREDDRFVRYADGQVGLRAWPWPRHAEHLWALLERRRASGDARGFESAVAQLLALPAPQPFLRRARMVAAVYRERLAAGG